MLPRSEAGDRLRQRPRRSRTTGCSATPAPPRSSPPTAPSTGCACPASTASPVFGRLVGGPGAGTFRLGPAGRRPRSIARRYRPRHRHARDDLAARTAAGSPSPRAMVAEVTGRLLPTTLLVRRLTAEGGPVEAVVDFDPRLGEQHRGPARPAPRRRSWSATWATTGRRPELHRPTHRASSRAARRRSPSRPADPLTLVLAVADREPLVYVDPDTAWAALEADEPRWRRWCGDIDDDLPHRDAVVRSLLTLRLLTYSPSGRRSPRPPPRCPRILGGSPQLGLPLRLAPRRQHRHRRLPRRRQARRGPRASWPGCCTPAASTGPGCRCCSPCTAATRRPSASSRAGPATPTARRCGSATAPPTSTSSTATAGSSTPPGCSPRPGTTSTPRPGGRCAASPTQSPTAGASPTPASGRSAATPRTTCTPS